MFCPAKASIIRFRFDFRRVGAEKPVEKRRGI